MLEKPEEFEKMMWECAKGNISTEDAAKQCGMKRDTFYSWLRKNEEAYQIYKANNSIRKKSVTPCKRYYAREYELEQERRAKEVMSKYHAKCKIADKVAQARALGMSYGYYSALVVNGLGKI